MQDPNSPAVQRVREASRGLVRELGFMEDTLAGTGLSASAVFAIIELGSHDGATAGDLALALRLEKSTVSRLLKALAGAGYVTDRRDPADARRKSVRLTKRGRSAFAAITATASERVATALSALSEADVRCVVKGLEAYANALRVTAQSPAGEPAPDPVEIRPGYAPGVLGRLVELHARHYARAAGLGATFEAELARDLSGFAERLDRPGNDLWTARRAGRVIGGLAIDGDELGPGRARLRWAILEEGERGAGVGARLLDAALAFVDRAGVAETHLRTLGALGAPRRLFERAGFVLQDATHRRRWGASLLEQHLVRRP